MAPLFPTLCKQQLPLTIPKLSLLSRGCTPGRVIPTNQPAITTKTHVITTRCDNKGPHAITCFTNKKQTCGVHACSMQLQLLVCAYTCGLHGKSRIICSIRARLTTQVLLSCASRLMPAPNSAQATRVANTSFRRGRWWLCMYRQHAK